MGELLFGRGPGAVRWVTLRPDGAWEISDNAGRIRVAQLSPASASLGQWLLLIWTSPARAPLRAFIDSASTDPAAFRALKGRLNC